ncbi:MAG: M23 family metallopeptidase [Thiolinea sp.]
MKVICISRDGCRRASFDLNPMTHLVLPASIIALLIIGLSVNQMLGLYKLDNTPPQTTLTQQEAGRIFTALESQMAMVSEIKKTYANYTVDVDTFSQRLGNMEAEIVRINALAKRVIKRAKLDPEEFLFDKKPSRGGLSEDYLPANAPQVSTSQLLGTFQTMESQLANQGNMLETLYQVMEGMAIDQEVSPSFSPVKRGYVSSPFGSRRDPFNGRTRQHRGIDFAGPRGTDIHSVASGVVSFVGRKGGYGIVVQVDHGDGLVSRYAHLNKALVEKGAVVKKAERIALMGSTGRSTGPHLHLEILKAGKHVDPQLYLEDKGVEKK